MEKLDFLNPYFLGPYGENDEVFEKILLEFFRDHVFWRRNFHPEDIPPISTLAAYEPQYTQFVGKMRQELHKLAASLKNSVPCYHPRYVGHMVSDMLLPGLIAQLVTTLYNPNNVNADTAPVTLKLELEVGKQLATMFGYRIDESSQPCAWGHLTSGGTSANYEGILNIRAAKFYPLALQSALNLAGIQLDRLEPLAKPISQASQWELLNLSIDNVLLLDVNCFTEVAKQIDKSRFAQFKKTVAEQRVEHLGLARFMQKHWGGEAPVLMVPVTAHYSWEKAMKSLGFGCGQIIKIPIDEHMRMDCEALDKALASAYEIQQPVLGVIGVLGSTEFGTIDPIHKIIQLRQHWRTKGLDFAIHVDAAWGGYIASVFRDDQGSMITRDHVKKAFKYFPSAEIYDAFSALNQTDSITVDPHKMGFLPFGIGAFVARNREVTRLFSQKAPYVFDEDAQQNAQSTKPNLEEERFNKFGQWIMEGSKPGATAAAAYVTHAVLPLNHDNMGRIISQTILSCEYFFDRFKIIKEELKDKIHLEMPVEPDTNLVSLTFNPVGNRYLALTNLYSYKVYEHFKVDRTRPVQIKKFMGTHTVLYKENLQDVFVEKLLGGLGIDVDTFKLDPTEDERAADHLFVLRHTTMNPWLRIETDGKNYIDRYFDYLKSILLKELKKFHFK